MNEDEQDGLLAVAKRLMEEAAGEFFDGNIGRAVHLAFVAYVQARKVQDANSTREGLDALVLRLDYMRGSLDHYFHTTADRDV